MMDYAKLWSRMDKCGMSDRDLARLAGVSFMTISRMRKNKPVTSTTLFRIAHVMNCAVDEILEYTFSK